MKTSEKCCLKCDDYQDNINTAFRDLRRDSEFTDVILACQDGHQVEAYKVINRLGVREKISNPQLDKTSPIRDLKYPIWDFIRNWVFSSVSPLLSDLCMGASPRKKSEEKGQCLKVKL